MNLPSDLRHYEADAFQLLSADECVIAACCLAVYALIIWPLLT